VVDTIYVNSRDRNDIAEYYNLNGLFGSKAEFAQNFNSIVAFSYFF